MKVGKICLSFFMSASILLAGCGNAKNKKGEDNLVGNDKDDHGCIASAGYTWSEVRQTKYWIVAPCPLVVMRGM